MSDPDGPDHPSLGAPRPERTSEGEPGVRPPLDPVSVAAVSIGGIGLVFFGIIAALVTAVLAAEAGRRAREKGRSQENAFFAFILAALDGVFWLFLHYQFHLPIWAG